MLLYISFEICVKGLMTVNLFAIYSHTTKKYWFVCVTIRVSHLEAFATFENDREERKWQDETRVWYCFEEAASALLRWQRPCEQLTGRVREVGEQVLLVVTDVLESYLVESGVRGVVRRRHHDKRHRTGHWTLAKSHCFVNWRRNASESGNLQVSTRPLQNNR